HVAHRVFPAEVGRKLEPHSMRLKECSFSSLDRSATLSRGATRTRDFAVLLARPPCPLVRDRTKVPMNPVVFAILHSDFVSRWLTLPSSNHQDQAEPRQCSLRDVLSLRFPGLATSQEIS